MEKYIIESIIVSLVAIAIITIYIYKNKSNKDKLPFSDTMKNISKGNKWKTHSGH